MGELSIEEKAKAYDEAIERARKINSGEGVAAPPDWTTCEVIFPELKESEDERIRNFLIGKFREIGEVWHEYSTKDILAWLEKRGEQNPAWSEEDEKMLNKCIEYVSIIVPVKPTKESGLFVDFKRMPDEKAQDWLKSLKERCTWKPSDEQIKALEEVRAIFHHHHLWDEINPILYDYEELMRDLKKLKG